MTSTAFSQLSDILFKECDLERVRQLNQSERIELVQIIKNLFTAQPTPSLDAVQGLVLSSLGDRGLQCAKAIIPELAPESYLLIPDLIDIVTDDTQAFETQTGFENLLRRLSPVPSLPPDIIDRLIDQLETKGSLPALILEPLAPLPQLVRSFYSGAKSLELINKIDPLCENRTLDLTKPKKRNLDLFTGCPKLKNPDYFVTLTYDSSFLIRYQAAELLANQPLEPELLFQLITLSADDVWKFILEKSVCESSVAVGNYLLTKNAQNFTSSILSRFICLANSEDQIFLDNIISDKNSPNDLKEMALKRYILVGKPPFYRFVPIAAKLSDELASLLYEKTGDKRLRSKALHFMRHSSSGQFNKLASSLTRSDIAQELSKETKYNFIKNLPKLRFPQLFPPILNSEDDVLLLSRFKSELLPILHGNRNPYVALYRTLNGETCLPGLPDLSCSVLRDVSMLCSNSPIREYLLKKQHHCLDYEIIHHFSPLEEKELDTFKTPEFIPLKLLPIEMRRSLFKNQFRNLASPKKLTVLKYITDPQEFSDIGVEVFNSETDELVKIALLRFLQPTESEFPFILTAIRSNPALTACLNPQAQSAAIIKLLREGESSIIDRLGQLASPTSELKVALYDQFNSSKDPTLRYKLAGALYSLFPETREEFQKIYSFNRFSYEFQELIQKPKISCNR